MTSLKAIRYLSVRSREHRLSRRATVLAAIAATAILITPVPELGIITPYSISPAVADDDDDGGGSARGSGRGSASTGAGGKRNVFSTKRVYPKKNAGKKIKKRAPSRAAKRKLQARPKQVLPSRSKDEIVVSGLSGSDLSQLELNGYSVLAESTLQNGTLSLVLLRVRRGVTAEQGKAEVIALRRTANVDFNHYYRPEQGESCSGSNCDVHKLVGWSSDRVRQCQGRPVIGIVDTQIDASSKGLEGQDIETITLREPDLQESSSSHGTAVASILVGAATSNNPGLIPGAKLIGVDPYYKAGRSDDRVDVYKLVRAIDLLASRNVDVINLSLSGPPNILLQEVIDRTLKAGVPIVAAAGNGGPRAAPAYPAAYEQVLAVTAVDGKLRPYRRAGRGTHIDFSAPGVNIATSGSRKNRLVSGTSFASPFVTAAVAIGRHEQTLPDPAQVTSRLTSLARDLGEKGRDPVYGWGLIQMQDLCASGAHTSKP